ncbi:MAG: hypothetical protein COB67_00670 [SAR324 cluster bacterium]|uniref:SPOR domain-containing protein n=1 Tax=SAR324 cluster bacterium TaxID=2024889 RepID=A0A2A4TAZ3_9DELT|nr:MAG: hypothetical protein COB67_00670 [SAR324 cluster bacterium]
MGDDEDFDLGDDFGLGDDSGDDFAGELDDMMGDDELGGDMDLGSDESDSELDSFFEDLSSIEEMDANEEPEESTAAESAPAEAPAPAAAAEEAKPTEKKSKKKLIAIILAAVVTLLGAAGGYWYFFLNEEDPMKQQEEFLQEEMAVPENILQLEELPQETQRRVPVRQLPLPVAVIPRPVVVAPSKYLIQIATCSFAKCKEDYLQLIREQGEPAYQKDSGDKYDFIEVISRQVYHYREANDIMKTINRENKQAGIASILSQSNGYRVTMGTFTALDRAKKVKFHLEKLFPQKILVFNMEHVRKSYETTKIYAGPYNGRGEAKKVLMELRQSKPFRGAFLVKFR